MAIPISVDGQHISFGTSRALGGLTIGKLQSVASRLVCPVAAGLSSRSSSQVDRLSEEQIVAALEEPAGEQPYGTKVTVTVCGEISASTVAMGLLPQDPE